ncbi:hypothetical protein [Aliiglaciecola sp. M165]|uniref:hypothetical protein n=1 Tax=Aliiglaciecola sp. M165 TaxID=2593649 RepID=UPI00117F8A38|nr:hypothetical protein [Aliiglaciecola sp. M165]TRY29298.1 hypothetical protein FM019_18000 [Aliiglaciecola sp. M165]
MFDYKITGSLLVFSMLVTLTGSVITLEDWEQLNVEQQIAIVERNVDLGGAEEALLVDMLKSEDDPQKLESTFSEKARELRIKADGASNPIKRIKYEDAAKAFEQSIERLRDLRAQENIIENKASELRNSSLSPAIIESIERTVEKLKLEYAQEAAELKLLLVQGFLALKIAEEAETVLQSKQSEVEEAKPLFSDLSLIGIVTFLAGLIGTLFGSAKLYFEYKKAKLDLEVAKARESN